MPPSGGPARPSPSGRPPRCCAELDGSEPTSGRRRNRMTTGAARSGVVLAEIRDTPLSVDEVIDAVRHPSAGAVVTFIGYVRERDHGEPVEVLDYTSHPTAERVAHHLAH